MTFEREELLAFHRSLVETPSVSHEECRIADELEEFFRGRGVETRRIENNVLLSAGTGPELFFCTHVDTVPPSDAWTRSPFEATREDGRVYGLGSNDAKASVAAMTAALLQVHANGGPCRLTLLLVPEEETGGRGAELAWPLMRDEGYEPAGVVVGEPTGLDIASAQRGMLVLRLVAHGDECHSGNATALGATNSVRVLAKAILSLEDVNLGDVHPTLGRTTLEPTLLRAGEAKNRLPDRASCVLDIRTSPPLSHGDIVRRIRAVLPSDVELEVSSDRLQAMECDPGEAILAAGKQARPEATVYGSRTMSDMVFFRACPAIKCGPGDTARSHTPDEFVLEDEIVAGADFYKKLVASFAAEIGTRKVTHDVPTVVEN